MNKDKILAKIEPMVNHEFLIETKREVVTNFSLQTNTIRVTTDKRTRTFSEDQFFDWAKKCLPVQSDSEELMDQIQSFEEERKSLPDSYKKKKTKPWSINHHSLRRIFLI